MYISKSKYCALWQCPKLLWLEKNHPELKKEDAARDGRMTDGNLVGDLAMGLFGDFTEVTVLKEDGRPDISAMLEKTQECMEQGVENICEASFSYEGCYCAVDILRKENGGYAIYEVKSSTKAKAIYGVDIAYQKYVLEQCGITVTGTYLVCMDSSYIRGDALDIRQLFKILDVTDLVAAEYPKVASRLQHGEQVLASQTEPSCDLSICCKKPYQCAYWEYCTRHLPRPSVFDLYNMDFEDKLENYYRGLIRYEDLPGAAKLSEMQLRQIRHATANCDDHIDKARIRKFLDTLHFPLYFLDFESMQPPIPPFPGTWPYEQIPFQYSLHYIETKGGPLGHKEFLAVSGEDPRRAIAESLCRDIPTDACVIAYNRSFECRRLEELAALFPDLSAHLTSIRSNVRDLLVPFRSGAYYNRAMGGSFSIKGVLPALFPDDPELNYHNLEGVHNGGEAKDLFPKLQDMPAQEAAEARKNLLAYCKLDTLATVKLWQKLVEAAK